jgi:hypothetical protein
MRKLAAVSILLAALATGCAKKPSYENACKHMIDLATDELDKQIEKISKLDKDGSMKKMVEGMRDKAKSSRGSDLETCVKKSEEKGIDASCVLAADSLDQAMLCGRKTK